STNSQNDLSRDKFDELLKQNIRYKEMIESIEMEKSELKNSIIQISDDSRALIKQLDSLQNEIFYFKGLSETKVMSNDKFKISIVNSLKNYQMITNTFTLD